MISYVLGFAFTKDRSKVVLMQKKRPEAIAGLYTAPGGKIEENELGISAVVREFEEETGVIINYWKNEFKITGPDYTIEVFSAFNDEILNAQSKTDEDVVVCDVNTVSTMKCTSDTKWIVPLILDPAHMVGSVSVVVNKSV